MTQRSSSALTNRQILAAAGVVLLGFLASGVLGLVRTAVFSATFGASAELDAFYAAQRIPETLFTLVAGGALGSSFLPVFARFLSAEDRAGAWRLASAVMSVSALAAALLAILLALLAPVIVPEALFPGRPDDQQELATRLTQIMLATTVIFSISGLLMGLLNAHQLFALPALAMSFNNLGQIAGALILARALPPASGIGQVGDANIDGLAWGAVLGAALHLAVQIPGLRRIMRDQRARLRVRFDLNTAGAREVLRLMGPRVLGLAVVQINFAVNIILASAMIEGSVSALNTAWFLMFFALGVIAQSMGTAVFPSLAALAAQNDMDGFRARLSGAMRGVLFLSFPAMMGLIALGGPLITLLFERGAWTDVHTRATHTALIAYAVGMAGHSLLEVLSRAFYALGDTWTPVRIGVAAMISNIALSVFFVQFVTDRESLESAPFVALALANSLTTLAESAALWWRMRRRINGVEDRAVIASAGRALIAAAVMGVLVGFSARALADFGVVIVAVVGLLVGVGSFFGAALLLRIDEARAIPRLILGR
jgi:putative peptidoglycan lipid II flippase